MIASLEKADLSRLRKAFEDNGKGAGTAAPVFLYGFTGRAY